MQISTAGKNFHLSFFSFVNFINMCVQSDRTYSPTCRVESRQSQHILMECLPNNTQVQKQNQQNFKGKSSINNICKCNSYRRCSCHQLTSASAQLSWKGNIASPIFFITSRVLPLSSRAHKQKALKQYQLYMQQANKLIYFTTNCLIERF